VHVGLTVWSFVLTVMNAVCPDGDERSVLFWTLANDVCTVDEAKSVYPLMGIWANVAQVRQNSR
jgi:AAA family ATP:ADP antiporter